MGATHDWSEPVDTGHLRAVRADAERFAAGGIGHLVLEVVAYAVDEAVEGATRRIMVTVHADGSVEVADDGRGTQVRHDASGATTVKPVMATRDLRFFGAADAPLLPDGRVRTGISVVAALSAWLTHTNRRDGRGWVGRYERGEPRGRLLEVPGNGATGTAVRFLPDPAVFGREAASAPSLRTACAGFGDLVAIEVRDEAPVCEQA